MHFVRRCGAVLSYEFIVFYYQNYLFNESVCFFVRQAFCKTVLCRFSYEFTWFLRRKTVLCRFSYEFIGFLRPELFFQ